MVLGPVAAVAPGLLMLAKPWALPPPVPPAHAPEPCAAAQYHQLDFWIGEWDWFESAMIDKDHAPMNGATRVAAVDNGCVLIATYSPWSLAQSTVVAHYDRGSGRWRLSWLGADGGREDYEGEFNNGKMVFAGLVREGTGAAARTVNMRMTWSRQPEGAVRHQGERSTDGGKTWSAAFDYTYWPKRSGG